MAQQIAMRVSEEEKELLVKYCKERGMTVSGLIRVAIKEYLKDTDIFKPE